MLGSVLAASPVSTSAVLLATGGPLPPASLLANPAASPLFLPTLGSLGVLLVASLGGLLLVERGRWRQSVLLRRWATWAVIAPLYLLGVLSGPLVAALFVAALALQAAREYADLVALPPRYRRALLVAAPLPALAALLSPAAHAALPTLVLLAGTLVPLLAADVRAGARHLALAGFGWAYLPWLLSYLLLLRDLPDGPAWLLALGLAVALADVGGYVLGRCHGRRKLAPAISPNKTWAGAVGSLLGATLGLALVAAPAAFGLFGSLDASGPAALLASLPWLLGLALVVAVGAAWGDLLESLLKRERGVKDAGAWLPGFGGLLDRIDSLVLVLPLAYFVLRGGLL